MLKRRMLALMLSVVCCGWSYFSRMQPESGSGDLGCGNQCWWKNGK